MKFRKRLRNRSSQEPEGDTGPPTIPPDGHEAPVPGYDDLDAKQAGARLEELSQVDLTAVETYERSHQERPEVLAKLRYMRMDEPLPEYDALSPEEIAKALADADAETIKAVRDYERKFGHRRRVMDEAMRLLPNAKASARETRAQDEKDARVREGFADREKPAG